MFSNSIPLVIIMAGAAAVIGGLLIQSYIAKRKVAGLSLQATSPVQGTTTQFMVIPPRDFLPRADATPAHYEIFLDDEQELNPEWELVEDDHPGSCRATILIGKCFLPGR